MSIEVIGAGLGRTGTLSLKTALERLGFSRCYHMVDVLARPGDARIWSDAAQGKSIDWDSLFEGYRATVDWPGCSFYPELLRRFPEAKVILTVRDPGRWYESARQTIYFARHAFPPWARVLAPRMRHFTRMLDLLVWDGLFRGKFEDMAFAMEAFEKHNEEVRRTVPPDRLLIYEVKEGWGPLCSFLGVPVPEGEPFPHVNDTAEFRARIERGVRIVRRVGYSLLGLMALGIIIAIFAAYRR
jgi:hypothetical protein